MKQQTSHNSKVRAPQAASHPLPTLKLGLDVHADSIVVVRILDNSGPQPAQKFTPAKFLTWVKTQLALATQVHSCYEAGPFGYGLHRDLVQLGVQNVVVQPVCLDERHTGVNHDKSDARELALWLDRSVAGNPRALATVRVPSEAEEQKRIESRQREQLKRARQRVAAQGQSLLLTQGFREKGTWWQPARWSELQGRLPAWLVERLEVFRRVLATLSQELKSATAALEQAAPAVRPKGQGGLTYEVIEREVGDWGRFDNRRQVGPDSSGCGGVSASGQTMHLLSITKHGNVSRFGIGTHRADRAGLAAGALATRLPAGEEMVARLGQSQSQQGRPQEGHRGHRPADGPDSSGWRWRTGRVTPDTLGWVMIGAAS